MKRLIASLMALLLLGNVALANDLEPMTGPVDPSQVRYSGFVYDYDTGLPVKGVCVYAGPVGCPDPALRTNERGYWAVDFPRGFSWDFHFAHQSYYDATVKEAGLRTFVVLVPIERYASGSQGISVTPTLP